MKWTTRQAEEVNLIGRRLEGIANEPTGYDYDPRPLAEEECPSLRVDELCDIIEATVSKARHALKLAEAEKANAIAIANDHAWRIVAESLAPALRFAAMGDTEQCFNNLLTIAAECKAHGRLVTMPKGRR